MFSDLISTLKHIGMQANLRRVCDGISFDAWKEEDHPRGNPNNAGQFAKKGSAIHLSPLSRQCENGLGDDFLLWSAADLNRRPAGPSQNTRRNTTYPIFQVKYPYRDGQSDRENAASIRAQVRAQKVLDEIGGTSIGSAMAKDFKDNGHANLIGRSVANAGDLAAIAKVFRNPSFETFRFFFVKDGKVVHQVGVTSRLPSHTTAVNKDVLSDIDEGLARVGGADGFYCLHNHPSGSVSPSKDDIILTKQISERFPKRLNGIEMLGHIVIDHGKYSVISGDGSVENNVRIADAGPDFKSGEKEQDCPLLGANADTASAIASLATRMQTLCDNGDDVQIITADSRLKTRGLASCSKSNLMAKSIDELGDIMRRYAISCASAKCAIAVDGKKLSDAEKDKLGECIRKGIFLDVVYRDNSGREAKGLGAEKNIDSENYEYGVPLGRGFSTKTDEVIRPKNDTL